MSAMAMVAPGSARPDVVSAAWELLAARDEVASAGDGFDGLTRNGRHLSWEAFTAWRDGFYVPAHAALASSVVTFTALVGRMAGDVTVLAEQIVSADIDAAVSAAAREAA